MTGYAVVVRHPQATVTRDELCMLVPALARRGPHGTSVVADGEIGLVSALLDTGDRRLAPAWVRAGPLVVVGQVRVDAREELVEALRGAGTNASVDDPDVRLLAQAWLAWGSEAPARVLGDYSVVVHDLTSHATTLVRDPFGVRMSNYHKEAGRLVVSNTLAALLDFGVPRELDEDAIADVVAEGYNQDPATTVFRAIRRVPPGSAVTIHSDGRETASRYWTLPAPPIDRSRDAAEIVARFRAALAARELADRNRLVARTSHLRTLVPTGETRRAEIVAEALGIGHVLSDVDGYGYREGTSLAVPDTPEPTGDPDLLALHDELRRASAHSAVAFWGEDPDSLLAPPHLGDLLRGSSAWRVALDVIGYLRSERRRPYLAVRPVEPRNPGFRARFESSLRSGCRWRDVVERDCVSLAAPARCMHRGWAPQSPTGLPLRASRTHEAIRWTSQPSPATPPSAWRISGPSPSSDCCAFPRPARKPAARRTCAPSSPPPPSLIARSRRRSAACW